MVIERFSRPLKKAGAIVWPGSVILAARPDAAPRNKPLPAIVCCHYEAPEWLIDMVVGEGWCIVTPTEVPQTALSDIVGPDLDWCRLMIAEAMALPFVDARCTGLVGGSAGGYQALMAAPHFPALRGVWNFSGPPNIIYNLLFWKANEHLEPDVPDQPTPPLSRMRETFQGTEDTLLRRGGGRLDSAGNRRFLPLDDLPAVSCPVLHAYSTADRLVPIYEVSSDFGPPHPAWPPQTRWRMEDLVAPECRGTLMQALGENTVEWIHDAFVDESSGTWRADLVTGTFQEQPLVSLPFSRRRRHSVVVVDEGPPIHPEAGHTLRPFLPDIREFFRWCFSM